MDRNSLNHRRVLLRRILRQFRREQDILQEELASRLGVNQSYVSKYETGGRKLELPEVLSICEALGVSMSELLRRYEEQLKT